VSPYQPRSTSYLRSQVSGRRSSGSTCFIWFTSGCIFGLIGGILLVLALATFAATPILPFNDDPLTGDADIVVAVDEAYLNALVAQRVNGSYPTGIDGLTLTSLQVDLDAENRMDLLPTFRVSAAFVQFDVNARVNNRLSVQEGSLAINMIGDPQLGDLNVSLGILPFDLEGTIRQAVDRVNNDLLLAEINGAARPSLESANFEMAGVATDDNQLTIRLEQR
jgi:hypothetical protein